MRRRDLIGAGLGASVLPIVSAAEKSNFSGNPDERNIVLVHGASHGGWCWRRVADRLRAAGHRVVTPTLTGLGERSHLRSPSITLNTHIEDIVNVIRWEELANVVLVAHSYGGTVITGVCDRMRATIARAVFIDANTPADGEPTIPGLTREGVEKVTGKPLLDGYLLPASDPLRLGVDPQDGETINWLRQQMTEHPIQTLSAPLVLENGGTEGIPRSYVLTTPMNELMPFQKAGAMRIANDPTWDYHELLVGHEAMVVAPGPTADLILKIINAPT